MGITGTDEATGMTVPNIVHIYYPAHDGGWNSGQDWLRPNIARRSGNLSNGYNYNHFVSGAGTGFVEQSAGKAKPNMEAKQHFRLDKEGIHWNNQFIDLTKWSGEGVPAEAKESMKLILDSKSVYVGATQGFHHSRAGYMFVRAVHNTASFNETGGSGQFDQDPINGGNL